jgi:asparagine synthase (glutamine-hydrolysing)
MPGIVGLLTRKPRESAEAELLQMVETLRHEPFYEVGTWIDEPLGVYVGWAVRKGSFSDGMPLRDTLGNIVLVFSGEDFVGVDASAGERSGSGCGPDWADASYLIRAYENDPAFPAGLNGRFHGLLVDRPRGTATLFNDRYGMHRLYFHESDGTFYFAAEAKALVAVRRDLRRLDVQSLGEFIACGCVLMNRTLFAGVSVMPPAASWVFRVGAHQQRGTYFTPQEWEQQEPHSPDAYYRELREVFSGALPRYFAGRQRIAMSLTGGLDTRMIMAWHKAPPGTLPCYTFGGMFRDCRDVVVARKVARACRQPHEVIAVGEEFLTRFPRYAERTVYLTDGCVEVSHAADLYVNERAREIAPVRMTGNYGGEVLRGIRAFGPVQPPPGVFAPDVMPFLREAAETFHSLLSGHALSFALFRQGPWHHYGLLALEQTQLSLRTPYLDNDLLGLLFRAPKGALAGDKLCFRLIADGEKTLSSIPTDGGLGGRHGGLAAAVRHGLSQFMRKAEYAYDYGMPQWLARIDHTVSPLRLERLFLGHHKFCHYRVWYRGPLARYVREMLLDRSALSRPYVDRTGVEQVVRGHLGGTRNYTTEIHKLLTLELVHRLFIDS